MTAQTNAERQAAYRYRRRLANDGQGDRRLNTWISTEAHLALDRLARHYGVTQREIIERLANQADRVVVDRLELDSAEWNTYFSVTP